MAARPERLLQHLRRWASRLSPPSVSDAVLLDRFVRHRVAAGRVDGAGAVLAELTPQGMAWGKGALLTGLLAAAVAFAGAGAVAHQVLTGGRPELPNQAASPPGQPNDQSRPRTDRHDDALPPGVIARLGTLRFRGVRGCLAFSPDGKLLAAATGEAGEDVTLFDTVTGRQVRRIAGYATLGRLAFSPDGNRLACSAQSHCRIFDVSSGKELFALSGVHGAFSGDGKVIVTGETSQVRSWDAATGKPRLSGYGCLVRQMALAADGRILALIDQTKPTVVRLVDLAEHTAIHSFDVGGAGQHFLALTRDGKIVATASGTGVRLWDVASRKGLREWGGRVGSSSRPVFSQDERRLAWTGYDKRSGIARLWIVERDGATPKVVGEPVNSFEPPCFSPDGKILAVITDAHTVSLREAATGKEIRALDAHDSPVIGLAFSADGRHVISYASTGILAWEARSGRLLRHSPVLPPGHEFLVPLLPGGFLLTGERTTNPPARGRFWLRDMRTGAEVMRFDGRPDVGPPNAVAAPGGRYVAVRGRAGEICVLDVRARRCVYRFDPEGGGSGLKLSADGDVLVWYRRTPGGTEVHVHRHAAGKTIVLRDLPKDDRLQRRLDNYPCVSPDGRWLLVPTEQGRLRRWHLITGKELSPLNEALRTVWGLTWSPDGRFVAVQGSTAEPHVLDPQARQDVRVWDMTTGARLPHLTWPHRGGTRVLFSHDGRTMLTTDLRGVIHLWEVATGKERGRLRGHFSYEIGSLALSADGRMLVSGGYDSQVLVWDLTGRMPDGQWRTARHRPEELRTAWEALAADDAKAAYAARWQLVADAEGTIALLRERLRPVPRPEPGQVQRLIEALDSAGFAERESAANALAALEESAATELRQALARKPSLEVRRRVETLLARLDRPPAGRQLQALRAIEVLEQLGTPEARKVLRTLADGTPGARVTREAKAPLRRWAAGR